jgi:peroxiredoxin
MFRYSLHFVTATLRAVTFPVLLAGVPFSMAGCSPAPDQQLAAGTPAPDFSLERLEGGTMQLADVSNNVLLSFWATWCSNCKSEVPLLNELQENSAASGVQVVGIAVEAEQEMVAAFQRRFGIKYPVLLDTDGAVSKRYGVITFPTTVLVRGGKIAFVENGLIDKQTLDKQLQTEVP